MTANAGQISTGKKAVAALTVVGLVVILGTSILYRVNNPRIIIPATPSQQGMPSMMGGEGEIGQLMVRLQENPNDFEALVKLGDRFMSMNSYDNAAVFYSRALSVDPSNTDVMYGLGISLYQTGDFEQAARWFSTILESNPEEAAAHFNLGFIQKHHLDKPDEARRHFETVIELNPAEQWLVEQARKELAGEHGE